MIPNVSQAMHQFYDSGIALDHVIVNTVTSAMGVDAFVAAEANHGNHSNTLLYCLTLLKEKVLQIQSLVGILVSPDHYHHHHHHRQPRHPSMSAAVASMGNLIQEVIMTASSMMFTCQQMMSATTPPRASSKTLQTPPKGMFAPNERSASLDWYADSNNFVINCGSNQNNIAHDPTCDNNNRNSGSSFCMPKNNNDIGCGNTTDYDVIEPEASELLAKYSHYCQICGKGFKRDANLRMHMRAHGDEYKSNSALRNTIKNGNNGDKDQVSIKPPVRKYSCPQEGCRWNRNHAKFQPLKSMICIKNHYKRSHCPKMYVCKMCNRKQFSVLSDLRTHEKHCGNLKWQCSCGTTFSRKDKLIGHIALFAGHTPAVNISKPATRVDRNQLMTATSMQIDDR